VVLQEMQLMNQVGRENVPEDVPPEAEAADGSQPNGGAQTPEPSPTPSRLNPDARPFQPSSSQPSLRESVLRREHVQSTNVSNAPSPVNTQEEGEEREDIEMGELSELDKDKPKRKVKEELEEGEASDESSDLSEPPEI
jgi:THO complex subunit 7